VLAPFHAPSQHARPDWLQDVVSFLRMRLRIVDYWHSDGNVAKDVLKAYCEHLGFEVSLDKSAHQLPLACWAVAACASIKLYNSHCDSPGSWYKACTKDAADPEWLQKGNAVKAAFTNHPNESGAGLMKLAKESFDNFQPVSRAMEKNDVTEAYVDDLWCGDGDAPPTREWHSGCNSLLWM
jgi:hypothetical protein